MDWLWNIKRLGRTFEMRNILWCGPSASGAEFMFTGTQCVITLIGDECSHLEPRNARVSVSADGKRIRDIMMNRNTENEITTVKVNGRDDNKPVLVRIVKLSEIQDSSFGIADIYTDGRIIQTPPKNRKIEFIGDSITCAYGVDANLNDEYRTNDEDAEKGYACLTAKLLNADCNLVAMSGFGILSGYSDNGELHSDSCVPKYYDNIGFSVSRIGKLVLPQDISWDFNRFIPDTVVINLGTNDWSYCKYNSSRCKEFSCKYLEFLRHVRERNPHARIVCSLGILGYQLLEEIRDAVNVFRSEYHDSLVDLFRFDEQDTEKDGVAVCGHPSPKTHLKAAKALAAYLS